MDKTNVLMYKGYYTKIVYDKDVKMLIGTIEGINDLVYFESKSTDNIEQEFHIAVDHYLDYCKANSIEPDKAYKGSFNVRIDCDLHKKLADFAFKVGNSLNSVVENAIRKHISDRVVLTMNEFEYSRFMSQLPLDINNKKLKEWKNVIERNTPVSSSSQSEFTN